MTRLKRWLTTLVCLVMPPMLKPPVLRLLGHRVANGARIGFSIIRVERLAMERSSRIGRLNYVAVKRLAMRKEAYIGTMNVIKGTFDISLARNAAIGNRNVVVREHFRAGGRPVHLVLGIWSKITASHYVNVSQSILIGNYSTVAGNGSQLWTHGFVHMSSGIDRAEVHGRIIVGNNCYIGSQSCVGPGIRLGDAVSVGAHSSVATSLLEPGVYVSQKLRHIAKAPEERLGHLEKLTVDGETIYWRKEEDRKND